MPNEQSNFGLYIPTTYTFDVSAIQSLDIDEGLKELLIRLYQNVNAMNTAINLKETGYYNTLSFVTGGQLFPNPANSSQTSANPIYRTIYRKTINFGSLPNNTSTSVAHNIPITSGYSFVKIYGAASDQSGLNFIPLPYASPTLADNIQVDVDSTDVTVTTGSDRTNFTITYIILEYIKF